MSRKESDFHRRLNKTIELSFSVFVNKLGLQNVFGETVEVEVLTSFGIRRIESKLKEWEFPCSVEMNNGSRTYRIPFAGSEEAIKKISYKGKILYNNNLLPVPYPTSREEIEKIRIQCFGKFYERMKLSKKEIERIKEKAELANYHYRTRRDYLW